LDQEFKDSIERELACLTGNKLMAGVFQCIFAVHFFVRLFIAVFEAVSRFSMTYDLSTVLNTPPASFTGIVMGASG